jgi:GNAT superfamily N-acetyltransferase
MIPLSISVTDAPSPEDLDVIGKSLNAFNDDAVGPSGRLPLAVLVRADGELVAGISGYTAWGWLYVQWLWVAASQRGQGLAGAMLAEAETEARRRLCHGAYIDTFNPAALHVYEKAGYAVFGALPDFPAGRTRSFLSKSLK